MSVQLLTEHLLEFLNLKDAQAGQLLSKFHLVGNLMSRLI